MRHATDFAVVGHIYLFSPTFGGSEDVEVKTVLASVLKVFHETVQVAAPTGRQTIVAVRFVLRTDGRRLTGGADSGPGQSRHGRHEAQLVDRCRRVWHPVEAFDVAHLHDGIESYLYPGQLTRGNANYFGLAENFESFTAWQQHH